MVKRSMPESISKVVDILEKKGLTWDDLVDVLEGLDDTPQVGVWIENTKGVCPVAPHTLVDVEFNGGKIVKGVPAGNAGWSTGSTTYLIKAYRVCEEGS